MAVVLPYLVSLTVNGFTKIFEDSSVTVPLEPGFAIILGGNGLGKTTLLQTLVYSIAGPLDDDDIEPEKSRRWTVSYFKGRLTRSELASATVEVTFQLGDTVFRLQRGVLRSSVMQLTVHGPHNQATYEGPSAHKMYEQLVCTHGQYSAFADFRFLVHRLLYLAEDRRGITWDLDAQARILMLLNTDLMDERNFREKRDDLIRLDSAKRHTHVRINHLVKALEQKAKTASPPPPKPRHQSEVPTRRLDTIAEQVKATVMRRQSLDDRYRSIEGQEAALRSAIHELTEQQRHIEANSIIRSLTDASTAAGMYLQKLLHHAICPSCGSKAEELQHAAQARASVGECPICGIGTTLSAFDGSVDAVVSQLAEKTRAREVVSLKLIDVKHELRMATEEESRLRGDYELARFSVASSDVPLTRSMQVEALSAEQLQAELDQLRPQEQDLADSLAQSRRLLEQQYNEYIAAANDRLERLGYLFSSLATEFLGTDTTLERIQHGDKLTLSLFVPVFDSDVRREAEDCSEAQRFFLDIAFRMAVLTLAGELSGCKNTFVCETPESALDVSYVDNAARMFSLFVEGNHSLVATTNIQRHGLAHQVLFESNARGLKVNVFDLLRHGRLSKVQSGSKVLSEIRDQIMEAAE